MAQSGQESIYYLSQTLLVVKIRFKTKQNKQTNQPRACGIISLSQDPTSLQHLFLYLFASRSTALRSQGSGLCDEQWGCTCCLQEGAEGRHGVKAGRGLCPQHEHIFSGDRKNGLENVMAGKCLYYQVSSGPRDQTARLATLSVPPALG